jgi:hypothetical protein
MLDVIQQDLGILIYSFPFRIWCWCRSLLEFGVLCWQGGNNEMTPFFSFRKWGPSLIVTLTDVGHGQHSME